MWILIPLSIIRLSVLGFTFLLAIPLMYIDERYNILRFLKEDHRNALICIPSMLMAGFITLQIWLTLNIPLA